MGREFLARKSSVWGKKSDTKPSLFTSRPFAVQTRKQNTVNKKELPSEIPPANYITDKIGFNSSQPAVQRQEDNSDKEQEPDLMSKSDESPVGDEREKEDIRLKPQPLSSYTSLPTVQRQEYQGEEEEQNENLLPTSVFGRSGAQSRENFVKTQEERAYRAGSQATQKDFSRTLHRTLLTQYLEGVFDYRWGDINGGRYNNPGMGMIYGSPSIDESIGEMRAYDSLANKTRVEFDYNASVDSTGKGGVANISDNLSELGMTRKALTGRKGGQGSDFWHRLTGEDPYLHSRALGRGASDAGASGIKVPSATGGNQVNIIPVNTDPTQVKYKQHIPYDTNGKATPTVKDSTLVDAMPGRSDPYPPDHRIHKNPNYAVESDGRTQRAGSGRYGALAAGGMAAWQNLKDGELSAEDVGSIGFNAGVGGLSGMANDALTTRMGGGFRGGLKGGGIVDAVTSGLFSTWDNARAYEQGDIGAGKATANVLVDTGVGVGSGLAGAAAGAAIGSVIPVAGTAVGAGIGFLAGMAGSYLTNEIAKSSGFTDWAKEGLGGWLGSYDDSLDGAWEGIAGARSNISQSAGDAWSGIKEGAGNLWNNVSETAGDTWSGIKERTGNLWNNASETAGDAWSGIKEGAGNLWNNASETAGDTWSGIKQGAGNLWNNASETTGNTWSGIKQGAGNLWNNASETAGDTWSGIKQGAGNLWNNASETAGDTWSGIKQGAGNLWNNASETAGDTWSGIKQGAGNAWDAVTNWW